jgi:tetratricopeptide (TPR) repeat protein
MRLRMLETLRAHAAEQLGEDEHAELSRRHADYYLGLAEQAEPELKGSSQAVWLDRLEAERDNFRAALDWASASGHAERGLRFGAALWRYWLVRGYWTEGRQRLGGLLALAGASGQTAARARALHGAGALARDQGDYREACAYGEESVAIWRALGNRRELGWALNSLGLAARAEGRNGDAQALYAEALECCREAGDQWGIGWALNDLANGAYHRNDFEEARTLYEESLAVRRAIGDLRGMAWSFDGLGNVACCLEDFAAARACQEESLAIRREVGDRNGTAWSLLTLGLVAQRQGDYGTARARYEESLTAWSELGARDDRKRVYLLKNLAHVAREQGDGESARDYEREVSAHETRLGKRAENQDSRFWSIFLDVTGKTAPG